MNYNKLAEEAHENAVKHGFWETKVSNEHCLMLVITEIAEMVEAHRVSRKASTAAYNEMLNKQIGFECFIKNTMEDEMADIVIRLADLAGALGVNFVRCCLADITGHIPSFHSPKTHLPCPRACAGMASELKSASNSVWISLPNGRKN